MVDGQKSADEQPTADDVRQRVAEVFARSGVDFSPHAHEAVLDYETAAEVRERFQLTGTETKSLFLRGKSGRHTMFVSVEGQRLDTARARAALGEKFSIASGDELKAVTGCEPGCAVPLGLPPQVTLLIDSAIEHEPRLILSPGPPTETIEVSASEWAALLSETDNPVVKY
ncbi:YbaK/EbsC family protein [Streptomyces sp. AN091965]|uniref:YbaK/EbsC family protein n=1 Tax=Streptomyces sp. AN091965 TaxID=2927803 RepID=UPI001F607C6A|nr:YbaK/EbsC family protein [Streptomyces sp. AN091965]MCI3934987.1 YbaK/EbsC family protein [Streptomyces sp. AN091965]